MNLLFPALMAIAIGMLLPLQGLVNARLGGQIGGPIGAAFVSFLVGTVLLGVYLLLSRTSLTAGAQARFPPWIWAGGVFGAIYVACFTLLIPRLGSASLMPRHPRPGHRLAPAGAFRRAADRTPRRPDPHRRRDPGDPRRPAGRRALADTAQTRGASRLVRDEQTFLSEGCGCAVRAAHPHCASAGAIAAAVRVLVQADRGRLPRGEAGVVCGPAGQEAGAATAGRRCAEGQAAAEHEGRRRGPTQPFRCHRFILLMAVERLPFRTRGPPVRAPSRCAPGAIAAGPPRRRHRRPNLPPGIRARSHFGTPQRHFQPSGSSLR